MGVAGSCRAGLIIEDGQCKYLQLEMVRGSCHILETIVEAIDPRRGDAYGELFELLAGRGARNDVPISLALGPNESLIRVLSLPGLSLSEARSALKYQFEDYFPFSSGESCFDVAEIFTEREGSPGQKMFVAAAARRSVIENIKAAAGSRFVLAAIEPAHIAFERALSPAIRRREGFAAVYAGARELLFILSNGRNGLFYRSCAVRAELSDYDERAAAEVKTSLLLAGEHSPEVQPRQLIVSGPCASEELCAAMTDAARPAVICYYRAMPAHGSPHDGFDEGLLLALGAAKRAR